MATQCRQRRTKFQEHRQMLVFEAFSDRLGVDICLQQSANKSSCTHVSECPGQKNKEFDFIINCSVKICSTITEFLTAKLPL